MFRTETAVHLIPIFLAWKAFLLSLAILCPVPGYDTSAFVLLRDVGQRYGNPSSTAVSPSLSFSNRISLNLLRWDALYFVKAAQRDYLYEQEWAFSWAHSHLLRVVGNCERPRVKGAVKCAL